MSDEPKQPKQNTADGMIVAIDDEVVWDGEGEQLGVPSMVGQKVPVHRDRDDDEELEPGVAVDALLAHLTTDIHAPGCMCEVCKAHRDAIQSN